MIDAIIVGSGASGVHAAWPLVEAGLRVIMLDVGERDPKYEHLIPKSDFLTIRRTDPDQHRYFLGDEFEGVPFGPIRVGAQLTPPRQHLSRSGPAMLPLGPGEFLAMQSLAIGGLASGWGAACFPFLDEEMPGWPIRRADLQPHYEAVARRIGVCGTTDDDLAPFFGPMEDLLPPARPDSNAATILRRYLRKRSKLNRGGLFTGSPWLAMATRRHRGRGPLRYLDMEFWADKDEAVYRPRFTLQELDKHPNFEYHDGRLVEAFSELDGGNVRVTARCPATRERIQYNACKLLLAAGALGTSRIVLESLRRFGISLPVVSNPYTYFPCLNLPQIGLPPRNRRHSLTQLTAIYDPDGTRRHCLSAQFYSYRSLLTFKLVKENPLATREGIALMRRLEPYLVIVGVHHEDHPHLGKHLRLEREEGPSRLWIQYKLRDEELATRKKGELRIRRFLRSLGCVPLKTIDPGPGASIHYAGSLPMTRQEKPLGTLPDGRLSETRSVYIADGAAFPNLPAKGLTFTLMANANRVGEHVKKILK